MAAIEFVCEAEGKNAEEAFQNAVENAKQENGNGGYSGSIAEKDEFVMINDNWKDLKARYAEAVNQVNTVIKKVNEEIEAANYDPDDVDMLIVSIGVPIYIPSESYRTKTGALNILRKRAKSLRALRDSCSPKMTTEDIVTHLMHEICDDRIDNKNGPAGCIDLAPKLTGKRKPKPYLFFGVAPM